MTPLGTSLNQKVIQPFLFNGIQQRILQKPILVIVITDGEPTGEPKNTVAQAIKNAKNMTMNSQYGPGAIAFEFAQVCCVSFVSLFASLAFNRFLKLMVRSSCWVVQLSKSKHVACRNTPVAEARLYLVCKPCKHRVVCCWPDVCIVCG